MPDIIVIGGANLDIKAKSLEPNHFGTSNPSIVTTSPGGVARNIAHNLARLGASVGLISSIGKDYQGDIILEATSKAGVNVAHVGRKAPATGTYLAVLNPDGELVTAMSDMRAADLISPDVIRSHTSAITAAEFIVADCNLPQLTLEAIAKLAREKLLIEPVSVPKSQKLAHLLKSGRIYLASPNLDQLESLTGTHDIALGCKKLHDMGVLHIVVHAGSAGAFVSSEGRSQHIPAKGAGVMIDVTGAGDAAVAGLVYGLLQGEDLAVAATRGQKLAGQVIASAASTIG
jgi:pseudouridine kinase